MTKEELIKEKFVKKCLNEFPCIDPNNGGVFIYKFPSLYLASINAYNEGKKSFYGSIENGRFTKENPKCIYELREPLSEEEFKTLFS